MPDHFTWIPFYEEAARKLLSWENRQSELIAFLDGLNEKNLTGLMKRTCRQRNFRTGTSKVALFLIQEIDPFTFFGAFNRTTTNANRIAIADAVKTFLGIEADTPKDFDGIPSPIFGKESLEFGKHINLRFGTGLSNFSARRHGSARMSWFWADPQARDCCH